MARQQPLRGLTGDASARAWLQAGGVSVDDLARRLDAVLGASSTVLPEGGTAEPKPTPEIERAIQRATVRALTWSATR